MQKVLVSACLLGQPVRYDGSSLQSPSDILERWHREGRIIPVCPELAAGLPVPRPPAEIQAGNGVDVLNGRAIVLANTGQDQTQEFVAGAQAALSVTRSNGILVAVLTDGSPSCGSTFLYDGTFSGNKNRDGSGVTAALLRKHGVAVFSQSQMEAADELLRRLDREDRLRKFVPNENL
jgi:uncharacterized protein YbbK (DUF523 family)